MIKTIKNGEIRLTLTLAARPHAGDFGLSFDLRNGVIPM